MPRISTASSSPASPASSSTSICATPGLFFPIDPGADASLGGMAATRASGTNAGALRHHEGQCAGAQSRAGERRGDPTARRAKKSAAGYDLTRLIVGSEGTLGIITEIDAAAASGIPEAISAGDLPFPLGRGGVQRDHSAPSSPAFRWRGSNCSTTLQVKACNAYSKLGLPETPTAVSGISRHRSRRRRAVGSASATSPRNSAAAPFDWATRAGRPHAGCGRRGTTRYWAVLGAAARRARALVTDVCVPISRLAECVTRIPARRSTSSGFIAPIVGHVGDGNFHMSLLVDLDDADRGRSAPRRS